MFQTLTFMIRSMHPQPQDIDETNMTGSPSLLVSITAYLELQSMTYIRWEGRHWALFSAWLVWGDFNLWFKRRLISSYEDWGAFKIQEKSWWLVGLLLPSQMVCEDFSIKWPKLIRQISSWCIVLGDAINDSVSEFPFNRGKSSNCVYITEAEDFDPSYRDASFFGSTAGSFLKHAPWVNNLMQTLPNSIVELLHPAMASFVAQKRVSFLSNAQCSYLTPL